MPKLLCAEVLPLKKKFSPGNECNFVTCDSVFVEWCKIIGWW